jgi:hypothetical protein
MVPGMRNERENTMDEFTTILTTIKDRDHCQLKSQTAPK